MPLPKLYFSETTRVFLTKLSSIQPIYDAKTIAEDNKLLDQTAHALLNKELAVILDKVPPGTPVGEVLALYRGPEMIPDEARIGGIVSTPGLSQGQPVPEFMWIHGVPNEDREFDIKVVMRQNGKETEVCRMVPGVTDDVTGCIMRACIVVDALTAFAASQRTELAPLEK